MDKPISVGDLVVVVRPPECGCSGCGSSFLGAIARVVKVWVAATGCRCSKCGYETFTPTMYVDDERGWFSPARRLKRIPDFPELADERHDEEIAA